MMAANVFLAIIPSQKAFVGAIEKGEAPDLSLAINAKRRSTHNNYLTLPVLFCMLANHAAFVYGHAHAWLLVVAFSAVAAFARHYFNEKHSGRHRPAILIVAAILFAGLAVITSVSRPAQSTQAPPSDSAIQNLITTHCAGCHAQSPTAPGFDAPPAGLVFEKPSDLRQHRERVVTSLQTRFMPLGNMSGMTDEERAEMTAYAGQ